MFKKKKNYSKVIVSETISEVFNNLVSKKNNTSFILDNQNKLKGVITIGDLRKAMFSNLDFNCKANKLMNTKFKFCKVGDRKKKIDEIFKLNPLLTDLPVLDVNKKVKYIFSRTVIDNQKNNLKLNSLVIMAGGYGKRLRPFTYMLPKPLLPLNNKTIIQEIIDRFIRYKIKNIFLISNYKKNMLKSFLKIKYKSLNFFEEPEFLGTFGGVKFLENKLTNEFF